MLMVKKLLIKERHLVNLSEERGLELVSDLASATRHI